MSPFPWCVVRLAVSHFSPDQCGKLRNYRRSKSMRVRHLSRNVCQEIKRHPHALFMVLLPAISYLFQGDIIMYLFQGDIVHMKDLSTATETLFHTNCRAALCGLACITLSLQGATGPWTEGALPPPKLRELPNLNCRGYHPLWRALDPECSCTLWEFGHALKDQSHPSLLKPLLPLLLDIRQILSVWLNWSTCSVSSFCFTPRSEASIYREEGWHTSIQQLSGGSKASLTDLRPSTRTNCPNGKACHPCTNMKIYKYKYKYK